MSNDTWLYDGINPRWADADYEQPSRSTRNRMDPMTFGTIIPSWQQHMINRFGWVAEGNLRGTFFRIHHGRDGRFRIYYRNRAGAYRLSATYRSLQETMNSYWGDTIRQAYLGHRLFMIDRI